MEQWLFLVGAVVTIFSVMFVGGVIRHLGWLTQEADRTMINVVVRVLVPALILDVVIGNPKLQNAANLVLPPIVGFASIAVGVGVALLVARLVGPLIGLTDPRQRRTFAMCVGIYNYGYIPLPLAEKLFDKDTVGVLFVHNLGVEVAFWTIALMALQGRIGGDWYKRIINAPLIAIVVAVLINATGVGRGQLPDFLMQTIHMLGVCAVPLALLLIGATVADHLGEANLLGGMRVIGAACVLRLGVIPALMMGAALVLPASVDLQRVIVLQAAMPAATFPIILAKHYGGDTSTAVRIVLGTTVVSLLTMPLWVSGGLSWFAL